jgi:hypothetical protein
MTSSKREALSFDRLREVLHYSPETGVFTWKKQLAPRGKVGDVAGCIERRGRITIRIDGRLHLAHRLAWIYMTGEWPAIGIDHKNVNPGDNRFSNLRLATQSQNVANTRIRKNSRTGLKGVSIDKARGRYQARITHLGHTHVLGRFESAEDAKAAYDKAAIALNGEFARL